MRVKPAMRPQHISKEINSRSFGYDPPAFSTACCTSRYVPFALSTNHPTTINPCAHVCTRSQPKIDFTARKKYL